MKASLVFGTLRCGFSAVLLFALAFSTGCATHRTGSAGASGVHATVDILGLPRETEGGATTNRNRIFQRRPAPPAPATPPPAPLPPAP